MKIFFYLFFLVFPLAVAAQSWAYLGLNGRYIYNLLMPNYGRLIVATSDGVYKNYRSDTVWTPIGLQGKSVRALFARDTVTMLASIVPDSSDTVSIYRTTNGGASWHPYQNNFGGAYRTTSAEAFDALDTGSTIFATSNAVVARSTNFGASWTVVWGGWDGFGVGTHFVKIDPEHPNVVWAGGESRIFQSYILKSIDGWMTWQQITPPNQGDNACYSIAIDRYDDGVYVGMEGQIVYSSDAGSTWSIIYSPPNYPYIRGLAASGYLFAAGAINTPSPQSLNVYTSFSLSNRVWQVYTEGGSAGQKGVRCMTAFLHSEGGSIYLGTMGAGVYNFDYFTFGVNDPSGNKNIFMSQNFPNPFSGTSSVQFHFENVVHAGLFIVRDVLGRVVYHQSIQSSEDKISFNGSQLPNGVYTYTISSGNYLDSKRMVIAR